MKYSETKKIVSRLLQFVKPEKKLLIWGTLFLGLGSAASLIFPQMVRIMVDEAVENKSTELVNRLGLYMVAILVVSSIAVALRYYLFTLAGERIVRHIRKSLFERMLAQEIGFFDDQMTGDLLSRLNTDAALLQNTLSVNISMALRNFTAATGGFILLFYTSPSLTIAMLAALPPAAFMAARFGKKVRSQSQAVQEALGNSSAVADESISNIRTVRAFAAETTEHHRFQKALDTALEKARQKIRTIAEFSGTLSVLGLTAIAAILWYGAHLVISGELTMGTLSAYILYTMTVAVSVATLGGLWTDFMSAIGAASRIFQIIDNEPSIKNTGGDTLQNLKGDIDLENIQFSYPTRPDVEVFKNLNLSIEAGEVVALVGPSGSGKSTIAALIQRFYDPTKGKVSLDGRDLHELDPSWLRGQIGTVSQEPVLMSTSIRENIAYGNPEATDEQIRQAAASANALSFIEKFPESFETKVGERGVQLSGGQKQRIAIARATLKDPRILILDEATSALDAESEHLVQEALQILMQGRTVIIIAHRLSTVREANRVILLDQGEIKQQGTHEELVADTTGPYYQLVQKQI